MPPDAELKPLPRFSCEQATLAVFALAADCARAVAREVAARIRSRQGAGRRVVLGLATGSTPVAFYAELVRLHREERLSFANVLTFNLDEYYPLAPHHPQSYHRFMRAQLFDHVDLANENIHLPDGAAPAAAVDARCRAYEESDSRRRRHRHPGPRHRPHRAHGVQRAGQSAPFGDAARPARSGHAA